MLVVRVGHELVISDRLVVCVVVSLGSFSRHALAIKKKYLHYTCNVTLTA